MGVLKGGVGAGHVVGVDGVYGCWGWEHGGDGAVVRGGIAVTIIAVAVVIIVGVASSVP